MNKTYIPAILVLIFVLIFHILGMNMYWYLEYSWYDIMMHIVTGAGIALSTLWFVETIKKGEAKKRLWIIIIATLIAGVLWEALEAKYGIAGFHF